MAQVKILSQLKEEKDISESVFECLGVEYSRGTITEIAGAESSGKTSLVIAALGELTRNGEVCAIVDFSNCFDPETAVLNGIILENILWLKTGGNLEQGFLIADYLVQAKGFGAIWLNLSLFEREKLRFVPGSYWYRFRSGIRGCPTILIVTSCFPVVGSAAKRKYEVRKKEVVWKGEGKFKLIDEFTVNQTSIKGSLSGSSKFNSISMLYEEI